MKLTYLGTGAAEGIGRAIERLNARTDCDVLLVGRGGGSIEDLWAFNEEIVARAIYLSEIPVISAVGHEPDVTISDYVADLRAATPSNAAELATPDKQDLTVRLRNLNSRMAQSLGKRLKLSRQQLALRTNARVLRSPMEYLEDRRQQLDGNMERLAQLMTTHNGKDMSWNCYNSETLTCPEQGPLVKIEEVEAE